MRRDRNNARSRCDDPFPVLQLVATDPSQKIQFALRRNCTVLGLATSILRAAEPIGVCEGPSGIPIGVRLGSTISWEWALKSGYGEREIAQGISYCGNRCFGRGRPSASESAHPDFGLVMPGDWDRPLGGGSVAGQVSTGPKVCGDPNPSSGDGRPHWERFLGSRRRDHSQGQ